MKTLVLGSGVSALIYLYYHPNAVAVGGKERGGLFAKTKNFGPQYLWVDSLSEKLLKDLNLPIATRTVRVGYYKDEQVSALSELESNDLALFRSQYAYKTRGKPDTTSYMSQGQKTFEVFTVPVDHLVDRLIRAVDIRIEPNLAQKIDIYSQVVLLDDMRVYQYDSLVSTIPAPLLLKLMNREHINMGLEAWNKAYLPQKLEHAPEWCRDAEDSFDYFYVADPKIPYHRVTFKQDGTALFEYSFRPETPLMLASKEAMMVQTAGQIIGGHEALESLPKNITLLGRYAEWRHGIKTNQVLSKILTPQGYVRP